MRSHLLLAPDRSRIACAQVELNLLSEVSRRSEGFFDALSSYETLTREVAEGCKQIEAMRAKLRSLEANLVRHSLRLPTLVRRRVNTAALLEKLRLVHAVWATQPTIQQLLTARDFGGALELISSSQQLLSTGAVLSLSLTRGAPSRPSLASSWPSPPTPSILWPQSCPA